jgi:hypothetical protein
MHTLLLTSSRARPVTCPLFTGLGVLLACFASLSPAWAQSANQDAAPDSDPLIFSAGLKTWTHAWDSWITSPTGTGVALGTLRYQVVQSVHSNLKTSATPFASVRQGRWMASLSHMQETSYTLQDASTPGGFGVSATRQETDASAGYYVLPTVALTLGFKRLNQDFGADRYQWSGPLLGSSASAPVAPGWSLYGTVGLGRLQARFPESQRDAAGHSRFGASYRLGEFGVAHGIPMDGGFLRAVAFTLGYRTQTVVTSGYALAVSQADHSTSVNSRTDLVDTTQGLALSLSAAF